MSSNWRHRLLSDPANWLLDADDNPSIAFWFLRDIVGRPEDAAAMLDLREKILFSQPVQEIFAAQNELGYWDNPDQLDEPRHRATLWALALLIELGIPRTSRRARTACEFALENLRLADSSFLGLLAHSLVYFNYHNDARLIRVLNTIAPDAERGNVFALWACADFVMLSDAKHLVIDIGDDYSNQTTRPSPALQRTQGGASVAAAQGDISIALNRGVEQVLDALARGKYRTYGAFPSFDPDDALLALRVLAQLNRLNDERARGIIEQVWARQADGARWTLGQNYAGSGVARFDSAQEPSKWATLNVLRVITKT